MFKRILRDVILFGLLLIIPASSFSQFHNTLISQKPKPKVTKSEMESDSVNYIDKPNTYRDRKTNIVHSVWTEFEKYKSGNSADSSFIMYARLIGNTKSWSKAVRISRFGGNCSNSDSTLKADVPVTGPGGELYVCWAGPNGLSFQRSLDTGLTWMPEEKIINPIKNGWDQQVEGLKTTGIPRMACVQDSGQFRGRIYITWSDEKNGEENKDVFLVYSDDQGNSWSEPILVTYRPNHKEQFNPAISIQPHTGDVFITYFDRQNYIDGILSDLYLACSKNGGLKFDYYKLNEKPVMLDSSLLSIRGMAFVPKSNDVKAIWSQTNEDNMLSIYSALISDSTIAVYNALSELGEIKSARSFRFAKKIKIEYEVPDDTFISAMITKPLESGKEIQVIRNSPIKKGKNVLLIDTKKLGLPKDNYILTFYYNNRNSFVWIVTGK